jgi:UDP-N-acetylglucosamine 2-epimerase
MKVATVVGTRPELIRLSRVIPLMDQVFEHILVHTGQNHDSNLREIFFDDLSLRMPDYSLSISTKSFAESVSNILLYVDTILDNEKPDAILLLGDTNSSLCSIPAKRRKIPIFHVEAGNRCYDMRVPEEINRRIVDHISDINICYTEQARRNLITEGLAHDRTFKLGTPLYEVLGFYSYKIQNSTVHSSLLIEKNNYFVVSIHRQESVDSPTILRGLIKALNLLAVEFGLKIIVSLHPRTKARLNKLDVDLHESIIIVDPLSYTDYIALQINSRCVLSDSGSVTEEASILGFPAVTLRNSFERQEGIDCGCILLAGVDPIDILQSVSVAMLMAENYKNVQCHADYTEPDFSGKLIRLIQGYTGYVRRNVWHKSSESTLHEL